MNPEKRNRLPVMADEMTIMFRRKLRMCALGDLPGPDVVDKQLEISVLVLPWDKIPIGVEDDDLAVPGKTRQSHVSMGIGPIQMRHLRIAMANGVEQKNLIDMVRIFARNQIAIARKGDEFTVRANTAYCRLGTRRSERLDRTRVALDTDHLMIGNALMV